MTSAKWFENPANILQLLRAMREDDDGLTADTCIEVLAKPWNWADEYERLCGFFHAGEVPTEIYEGMMLMRPSDDEGGRPAVVYCVTRVDGQKCDLEVSELRGSRNDCRGHYVGDSSLAYKDELLGGEYTLEEDFQLEVER